MASALNATTSAGTRSPNLNLEATETGDLPAFAAICSMLYLGSSKSSKARSPCASSIEWISDLIRFSTN